MNINALYILYYIASYPITAFQVQLLNLRWCVGLILIREIEEQIATISSRIVSMDRFIEIGLIEQSVRGAGTS